MFYCKFEFVNGDKIDRIKDNKRGTVVDHNIVENKIKVKFGNEEEMININEIRSTSNESKNREGRRLFIKKLHNECLNDPICKKFNKLWSKLSK